MVNGITLSSKKKKNNGITLVGHQSQVEVGDMRLGLNGWACKWS